jgi:CspA family cold shock protein
MGLAHIPVTILQWAALRAECEWWRPAARFQAAAISFPVLDLPEFSSREFQIPRIIWGREEFPMRQTGTVKFFNHSRGFGFITPDDGGKDVFLHISALQKSGLAAPDEGARVSFETEPDRRGKGPQAINVQMGE